MATVVPDLLSGIVALMRADVNISDMVGTKVYGMELPRREINSMPQKLIIVSTIGGWPQYGHMQLNRNIVEVRCFGEDYKAAWEVYTATHLFFKNLNRQVYDTLLVHAATPVNGPISLQDPRFEWPNMLTTWRLLVAEAPVT